MSRPVRHPTSLLPCSMDKTMTPLSRFPRRRWYGLPLTIALLSGCAGVATNTAVNGPQTANPALAANPAAGADSVAAGDNRDKSRIYQGTGVMVKTPAAERPATGGAISLNFEAADIRDIAKTVLAEILKESYIVDPKVGGTISFRTVKPLPREALLPTLETILRLNGVAMVRENGIYKIMPGAGVKGSLSPRLGGPMGGYGMQVVPLKYIGSREMAKILEGIAADATAVKADELRNLLILAGTQNEIQHMLDAIDMFDVDWLAGMSVGLFPLQNTDVKTIDTELTKILGDKNANPFAGALRVIPLERLNAFVIITPQPHYLEQAKLWLERLDQAGNAGSGTSLHVYHVQNGKAEHLAELLNQAFGGGKAQAGRPTNPTVAPGLTGTEMRSTPSQLTGNQARPAAANVAAGAASAATLSISDESGTSEVRVVADKETNSLLILANQAGYDKVVAAIKRLDESPRQVLIEVLIAEVSLTDEFALGVEWSFTHGDHRSGKLDTGDAGIAGLAPGFSLINMRNGAVQAALNMLAKNGKVNVLSSPHIMVADNQTAKIQVGESLPITQSTLNGTTTVNSTSYLDTGVILSVTPRINAGGLVNLEIDQEFSVPVAATSGSTSTNSTPSINKRTAKTKMTAQSGETMVLGGLISEKSTNSSSGLPVLSALPVVGGLFGSTDRLVSKTELIVLITPRVANNAGQAKAISDELRRKMSDAQDLADCGTANLAGYTSRGGLWCLQPGRLEGKIDRMKEVDSDGQPIYVKQRPSIPPANMDVPYPSTQPAQGLPIQAAPAAVTTAPVPAAAKPAVKAPAAASPATAAMPPAAAPSAAPTGKSAPAAPAAPTAAAAPAPSAAAAPAKPPIAATAAAPVPAPASAPAPATDQAAPAAAPAATIDAGTKTAPALVPAPAPAIAIKPAATSPAAQANSLAAPVAAPAPAPAIKPAAAPAIKPAAAPAPTPVNQAGTPGRFVESPIGGREAIRAAAKARREAAEAAAAAAAATAAKPAPVPVPANILDQGR